MIKKLLPIAGIVFIATILAVKTDWDEKLTDEIEPLLMTAAKIKATLNGLS
ncbi:MAG: hypothetical protein H6Q64_351 [Firmicutes bacterium]|nr:hypothetical protein [Bacillota bacterium]